ncbi:ABC transporter permease [Natronobacterium gregoryi]|uniref:NifC-like ABC-type porter n=2 Tax=Natronobacterium gregoryi TaxID=44930 RepID=L0AKI5_NATGS|nr:ABC transporter permease [Natronobacterium gregoryi]AFZ73560.1 NifC-like ABC-type porter [Natronobacterium gregoryi SP2]ELY68227.1 NifC-like ABC-type porter [Natronobacterium gregoryi SP2]PLK20540.1 sulfate ABC transporter permease [Natronobacterium gregoryi SP2]SFJ17708.1 molybdate/tungstate transport system permease protein [Natronobacterium gregoryi]
MSTEHRRSRWTVRTPELLVPATLGALLLAYFAVPFVAFLSRTGAANVLGGLASSEAQMAIRNSLLTAPVSTTIATIFGVPLAYVLARQSFPGKRLVEALVILPLIVPPVVGGAMLLTAVGRFTPIGSAAAAAGVPLTDSLIGVVLAQTFVAAPFVVITARAGFGAVDDRLEQASRSLGYGPIATFWHVSLPLARGAIVAGIVLTFARAIGEFGATMMVAYNPRTMPTRIWVDFISGGIDAIVPLALALLAITLVVLAAVQRFGRVPTVIDR